jgi:hypothetical protein
MMTLTTIALVVMSQASENAPSYDTTLDFHYYHQFDSSITSGGNVEVSYTGVELRIDAPITKDDDLQYRFQYQRDDWDFGGTTGLGGNDPWDAVNTLDFALQWTHQYNNNTSWFVGGIIRASYEDGANMTPRAGGTFGIVHSFSSDVVLGIGAGVIGQAQDDPRVFPLFVVEWKINETLRLTSNLSTRFGSRTGLELVWTPRDHWSFGAGYSYSYSRFRLDDTGFAQNGAGEATAWPLTFRATYKASPTFDLSFVGAIVLGGHLEVTNGARQLINTTDYENAGAIGIFGQVRF